MKKSIFTISILLSVILGSCTKDDSTGLTGESGTYKLVMEGNTVAEGTSSNKVLMSDNLVNIGGAGSDFVMNISEVPETIGASNEINLSSGVNFNYSQIKITGINMLGNGEDEIYFGKSGMVTRTSATKISFSGFCQPDASGTVIYSFSGYMESDAYKVD